MSRLPPVDSLDLSSRRSIDICELSDDVAVVRYFYHEGRFWLATIPLYGVESICGQAFNFSPVKKRKTKAGVEIRRDQRGNPIPRFGFINHCQCRFRMQRDFPVQLYDVDPESPSDLASLTPVQAIDDFVYSIEAVGRAGAVFDFWNGMLGSLVCAHRFLSTQEMVFERAVVQNYYVRESPPLPLSAEELKRVLVCSIQRADKADLQEAYYLYRPCRTNNCTSNPFQILDQCVDYSWRQRLGAMVYRLPLHPRWYLRFRGLDSDPTFFRLARSDFSDFIAAESTRKRKRAVVRAEIKKRRAAKKNE